MPLPVVRAVEVEYELDDALEWADSRAGEIGADVLERAPDFGVGIVTDGLTDLEDVEAAEVTERVSGSTLTLAESGSPYSSLR